MLEIVTSIVHTIAHYLLPIASIAAVSMYFIYKPIAAERNMKSSHNVGLMMDVVILLLCTLIEYLPQLGIDIRSHGNFLKQVGDPYILLMAAMGPIAAVYSYPVHYSDKVTAVKLHSFSQTEVGVRMIVFPILLVLWFMQSGYYNPELEGIDQWIGLIFWGVLSWFVCTFIPLACLISGHKCHHCNYFADQVKVKEDKQVVKEDSMTVNTVTTTVYQCVNCGKTFTNVSEDEKHKF